jgi:6,7-dimethyl-8-ribityllumazine synthase
LPPAIRQADRSGDFDGFVALGCVIRGETTHYDTVCNDSSRGLMQLGLAGFCIGNGILTVENYEQAAVRADPEGQNKGGGAAAAALHLVAASRRFAARPGGVGFVKPQADPS